MAENFMSIERNWLKSEVTRIVHRKLHVTDEQNGKCVEAAEEIMSLLPADDESIDQAAYIRSLESQNKDLRIRVDALVRTNRKLAENSHRD